MAIDYDKLYAETEHQKRDRLIREAKETKIQAAKASVLQLPDDVTDVKELAKLATPQAIRTLHEIAQTGASESARVSAASAILDRGWGKPAQQVAVSGSIDLTQVNQMIKSLEMELTQRDVQTKIGKEAVDAEYEEIEDDAAPI